ncbi:MAG: transposase zinc-binding domain-containing protein [Verrucomicrobia bacterium]|nr:transposase zinc-binding domain-containing protein [Verrucomicrobiota bacterium]MCG2679683.1 transposase zinc-binding domain-containing protein [Kiritimatiellia bacterium]
MCVPIDYAKADHTVLFCNGYGEVLRQPFTAKNTPEGVAYLVQQIQSTCRHRDIAPRYVFCGGEDGGPYALNFIESLRAQAWMVCGVNAHDAKKQREKPPSQHGQAGLSAEHVKPRSADFRFLLPRFYSILSTVAELTSSEHIDKATFKRIFREHWPAFKAAYPRYNTEDYNEVIQKMLDCGDPDAMGYAQYRCPHCGETRRIAFTCKSCFCLSCAKVYTDRWVDFISRRPFIRKNGVSSSRRTRIGA